MWPLLGIAVVIAGFAARRNPLLVIAAAAAATGWAAGAFAARPDRRLRPRLCRKPARQHRVPRPAGDRPARALRIAGTGADADRAAQARDGGAFAARLFPGAPAGGGDRACRSAARCRWCVRSWRRWRKVRRRPKPGRSRPSNASGCARMRRPAENIGVFFGEDICHRHRLDPADQGLSGEQPHPGRAFRPVGVGDPDRDTGGGHSRDATAADRSEIETRRKASFFRVRVDCAVITLEHIYSLSGAFLAVYAVLSARDGDQPEALRQCRVLGDCWR